MPLDPQVKALLDQMAGLPRLEELSVADARKQVERRIAVKLPSLPVASVLDRSIPGPGGDLPVRIYTPNGNGPFPLMVFFHGSGFVLCSLDTHDGVCRNFCGAAGCVVVSVDYRLAPEHKFPAAVEDAIAATEWAARQASSLGIDAERLVVGGDSAGATLAAIVCQEATQNAGLSIVTQCLICPVLDFEQTSPSREAFAEDHLIDRITIEADLADYLPEGIDAADPRISPLRATRLAGLPPTIIHTAEFDPMRDEGNAYARRLLAAGVTVEHICHDGMVHNFHAMGAILPQAQLVLSQIGEQVRRAVG